MQIQVFNLSGEAMHSVELDDYVFGIKPNIGVMHQAMLRQQANARLGTHDTKTRAEVSGGGRKPWRQKGTGRARQGSTRSPQWRHGGVVFGPHPRKYTQAMPKKMRRLAIRSALSAKAAAQQVILVDNLTALEPRTKAFNDLIANLKLSRPSALVLVDRESPNIRKAANNLPKVKTLLTEYINILDLFNHEYLVIPVDALEIIYSIYSEDGVYTDADTESESAENTVVTPKVSKVEKPVAKATVSETKPAKAAAVTVVKPEVVKPKPVQAVKSEVVKPELVQAVKPEVIKPEPVQAIKPEVTTPSTTASEGSVVSETVTKVESSLLSATGIVAGVIGKAADKVAGALETTSDKLSESETEHKDTAKPKGTEGTAHKDPEAL